MIRCHLSVLMGKKKMNIADVNRATGLNRTTITHLYYETTQRIDLQAIDRLCILFDCQVGDLLEWVPDEPTDPKEVSSAKGEGRGV